MSSPLRVLILEDRREDALLMVHELRGAGFEPEWQRVDSEREYVAQLNCEFDVILADYTLPGYDARRALQELRMRNLDIPLIIVSGTIGEDSAVAAMRAGASDYLFKDRLARLGPAVQHALQQKRLREEKRRADELVKEREKRFRALSRRFSELQENERKLIAADLHDSVVQWLSATLFSVEAVRRLLDRGDLSEAKEELAEIESALQYSIRELRTTIVRLFPAELRTLGLVTALRQHIDRWRQRSPAVVTFDVTGRPSRLPLVIETGIYRICQEALNNAAKHAQATEVTVTLDFSHDYVTLRVWDDGIGIPNDKIVRSDNVFWFEGEDESHIGLLDMCERAQQLNGHLELQSGPGAGTRLSLRLPRALRTGENDPE